MKKIVALLFAILMTLTMGMTVYAQPAEIDDLEDIMIVRGDPDIIMANDSCPHPSLVRITENEVRYVKASGSLHKVEEYFTARCSECMKYQKEIIDSQVVESHTMVLITSKCDEINKKHLYVYSCQGLCNYEEQITVNCSTIHAIEDAADNTMVE